MKREAGRLGVQVLQPDRLDEPGFAGRLRDLAPRTIVVVAYGRILPPEILGIPPRWCINLHASILPKYRGAAPIARAILAGEKVTGCTTMKLDQGLDTGEILMQRECAVGLNETAGELSPRLAALGADLLVETLRRHERGELEPRRQDALEASLAPSLTKEDGRIDWAASAREIACRVRACNPWPLAFSYLRGQAVQILQAEESFEAARDRPIQPAPGEVVHAGTERILVHCPGHSRLAIQRLRFPGGKAISARDAVNGRLVRVGETFAQGPAS